MGALPRTARVVVDQVFGVDELNFFAWPDAFGPISHGKLFQLFHRD
jgi:hypothetical protein